MINNEWAKYLSSYANNLGTHSPKLQGLILIIAKHFDIYINTVLKYENYSPHTLLDGEDGIYKLDKEKIQTGVYKWPCQRPLT